MVLDNLTAFSVYDSLSATQFNWNPSVKPSLSLRMYCTVAAVSKVPGSACM